MAAARRRADSALIESLLNEPYKYDFFQAVRLLGLLTGPSPSAGGTSGAVGVGYDGPPQREFVRFRSQNSLAFPSHSVSEIREPASNDERTTAPPIREMLTTFLGLTGAQGALPHHYTRQVLDNQRQKDPALADFLDLFHHRIISLLYRAWEKYRFPILYEHASLRSESKSAGHFLKVLQCLVGVGTYNANEHVDLCKRLHLECETLLYFSGHFSHFPRSAIGLRAVLTEYLGADVQVEQFVAQWLYLDDDQRFRFSSDSSAAADNCRLGVNAIVGQRVRSFDSRIRLKVGPLTYKEFIRFLPTSPHFHALCQLIRLYIGPEMDFDVQLSLQPQEVPWCRLSAGEEAPQLGYNMWVRNRAFSHVVDDAIFSHDGQPCCQN